MSIADLADRPPKALADRETLDLGGHRLRWYDTPHLPHAWECGFLMDEPSGTLLCGDLFTQPGADLPPLTETDILGPSEDFRQQMDYFSHTTQARALLDKLAAATDNPRLHARQRLAGRRRGAAPGPRRAPRRLTGPGGRLQPRAAADVVAD